MEREYTTEIVIEQDGDVVVGGERRKLNDLFVEMVRLGPGSVQHGRLRIEWEPIPVIKEDGA